MTTEQRILQIEAELASLKADLAKEAPTMERQAPVKGWELVTIKYKDGGRIYILNESKASLVSEDGRSSLCPVSAILQINKGYAEIISVRRISDGALWKVGMFVKLESPASKGWDRHPVHVIKYFHIGDSGQMYACCDSNLPVCGPIHSKTEAYKSGSFLISELRQSPKPLFTTADGVELFEGDKAFKYFADGTILGLQAYSGIDTSDVYSTPEAVEKAYDEWVYIQPVLSIWDFDGCSETGEALSVRLKQLVKDKIAKR